MEAELLQIIHRLLSTTRMAALGTLREGAPFVSLTTVAPWDDFTGFWLHLSRLAFHTRHIEDDSRVSLMVWEEATLERNPQTLARISLAGEAVRVDPDSSEYDAGKATYLKRNPDGEMMFQMADFALYRVTIGYGRLVGGFGAIHTISPSHLRDASRVGQS